MTADSGSEGTGRNNRPVPALALHQFGESVVQLESSISTLLKNSVDARGEQQRANASVRHDVEKLRAELRLADMPKLKRRMDTLESRVDVVVRSKEEENRWEHETWDQKHGEHLSEEAHPRNDEHSHLTNDGLTHWTEQSCPSARDFSWTEQSLQDHNSKPNLDSARQSRCRTPITFRGRISDTLAADSARTHSPMVADSARTHTPMVADSARTHAPSVVSDTSLPTLATGSVATLAGPLSAETVRMSDSPRKVRRHESGCQSTPTGRHRIAGLPESARVHSVSDSTRVRVVPGQPGGTVQSRTVSPTSKSPPPVRVASPSAERRLISPAHTPPQPRPLSPDQRASWKTPIQAVAAYKIAQPVAPASSPTASPQMAFRNVWSRTG